LATPGRDAVLGHLRAQLRAATEGGGSVAAVWLGDNIYEVGARPTHVTEDRAKLAALIEPTLEHPGAQAFFTPGNHDWGGGAPNDEGLTALMLQRSWVEELGGDRAELLPGDGCMGPVSVEVTESVHLIFLDTEALLRGVEAPCPDAGEAYARLARELSARRDARVLLLTHHPLASGGKHGGHRSLLAAAPTVSYVAAKTGVEMQDLRSRTYRTMIEGLAEAFETSGAPPLAIASGHEHNLQVIREDGGDVPWFQLISGSVAKTGAVGRIAGMRYATGRHGYMRLEFRDEDVDLTVFAQTVDGGGVEHVFSCRIAARAGPAECPEAARGSERP
jgi:hypothetical protein